MCLRSKRELLKIEKNQKEVLEKAYLEDYEVSFISSPHLFHYLLHFQDLQLIFPTRFTTKVPELDFDLRLQKKLA
jgi:hypothetical protein